MNKKLTAVGLTAGLLAGAGAGLILEVSGSAGAAKQSTAAAGTDDNGTGTDADRPDPGQRLQEILQPLVDDGTIMQAQADAVIAALQAAAPKGGPGPGHGPGRGPGHGPGFAIVAETLGLTEAEVRDAISNGQTLAQLAAANGSSADELVAAILADIKTHIDERVAAGDLTQDEADSRLAEAETRVGELVNNTKPPEGGPGFPDAPGADDAATAADGS